jgi:hypothetical protein
MLVKRLCVLAQHSMWPPDYNCQVFPEGCCLITVVCCRSILPGRQVVPAGGQAMNDPRRVRRQTGLRAVRPRAPPTRSGRALSAKGLPRSSRSEVVWPGAAQCQESQGDEGRSRMMRRFRLLVLLSLLALSTTGV